MQRVVRCSGASYLIAFCARAGGRGLRWARGDRTRARAIRVLRNPHGIVTLLAMPLVTSNRPVMELGLVGFLPLDQLDLQPFGVIRLDRQGTVLTFNTYEERLARKKRGDCIGRNFFLEIAPCTRVQEFHGRFLEAVAERSMNVTFGFVFPFEHGTRHVDISLFYKGEDDTVWLIVRGG